MVKLFIELIFQALKLLIFIIKKRNNLKNIEEKIKVINKLLKEALEEKTDIIDDESFIENLEWEQETKYEMYKDITLNVLNAGGSLKELEKQAKIGMGNKVLENIDEIQKILNQDISLKKKAILIAKQLII